MDTDIAVSDGMVVGTYGRFEGETLVDARGRIVVPGFIDTHLHVESSLGHPSGVRPLASCPMALTTAICDPQ